MDLVRKHQTQEDDHNVGIFARGEVEEIRGHARKAMHAIQQGIIRKRGNVGEQFNVTMMQTLINKMEMVEAYGPPRVAEMKRQKGFKAGWSLDLTTDDEDGKAWVSNEVEMRNRAARKVLSDEPLLLIGRPRCIAFGSAEDGTRKDAFEFRCKVVLHATVRWKMPSARASRERVAVAREVHQGIIGQGRCDARKW